MGAQCWYEAEELQELGKAVPGCVCRCVALSCAVIRCFLVYCVGVLLSSYALGAASPCVVVSCSRMMSRVSLFPFVML